MTFHSGDADFPPFVPIPIPFPTPQNSWRYNNNSLALFLQQNLRNLSNPPPQSYGATGSVDLKLGLETNDPIGIALGLDEPATTGWRLIVSATPTIAFT